jgi:energy-coupling factor transporter ATP-binding protein EcfA2
LILVGPGGAGKTRLAKSIARFITDATPNSNCLMLKDVNDLRGVNFSKDLYPVIIFDDCETGGLTRSKLLNILEVTNKSSVRVLHDNIEIPADTRKIITTNNLTEVLGPHLDDSIARRCCVVEISSKLS